MWCLLWSLLFAPATWECWNAPMLLNLEHKLKHHLLLENAENQSSQINTGFVFKNPNNVRKSTEVYSLEVCLSPVIWRGDIYPRMQHREAIQIPMQIARKSLGLCKETTPYWEKLHRLFGWTPFTSTRVWDKVKALGKWAVWVTERLFNTDETNYILWVFVPSLAYMGWIRNEGKKTTQSSLWSWSCQSC